MREPLRVRATRRAARETFPLWRRLGLHVTAVHFYEPVPDTRQLPEGTWEPKALVGIEMNDAGQLALLGELSREYRREYAAIPAAAQAEASVFTLANPSFGPVDAEILYALVRKQKPERVIEVGSGFTSLLIAQALRKNRSDGADEAVYTAIDPYPNDTILGSLDGMTRLIRAPVQQVPLHEFAGLGDGDILFIDSSHVLGIGTDVQYLFLEVIPRLAAGVLVHIHDIFLPGEYPRSWVTDEHRFWTEQYVLQAFLMFNDAWEVEFAASHMRERHADALAAAIPSFKPGVQPGSFWMRRRRPNRTGEPQ